MRPRWADRSASSWSAVARVVLAGDALTTVHGHGAVRRRPVGARPPPRARPRRRRGRSARRTFIFQPTIGVEETFTTNANFDRGSEREADVVTMIRPGFV